ncbi:MAG: putative addiction module antidote protein [Desulfomicrobium sp.]|nr:putative addiction module antidote protein [Pseudomonadota bacterium]MBV1711515.1 putative addiction module antidote protein [Desulfomicrobium sp.]MBU4572928.1 putative addiction module antidote protein [Pseudomonadota bacterium]MBU4594656.1 putative addiction module antidote protein [Pseudomonadota bacterium]MBV1718792.1 putative addiction module antidote protein [Desulfomicrobium sp.]
MYVTKPFDDVAIQLYRDDPALAADMLNACLKDGDTEGFLLALRNVSKAFGGMPEVARATGLHEKTLYKSLSSKGNPNLKTLMGVAGAMGMRIALVPAEKQHGHSV